MDTQWSAEDILQFLSLVVIKRGSSELSVNCPFCTNRHGQPDFKGHMNVNRIKQTYHCHRCGRGGSLVGLYATLYGLPYSFKEDKKEAFKSLHLALYGEGSLFIKKRIKKQSVQSLLPEETWDQAEIKKTYRLLFNELTLTNAHQEKLLERGFTKEDINRLEYRSAPLIVGRKISTLLLEKGCDLSKVPGFFVTETGEWDIVTVGSGIFIPQKNDRGEILGVQTRLDRPKGNKFFTFSGKDKNMGTPAKASAHFTGLPFLKKEVVFTEGAMKADLASSLTQQFFLSVPGVTQFMAMKEILPNLIELNVSTIKLAFDMDKLENPNVMNALQKAMKIFYQAGFSVYVLNWETHYKEASLKGIDDFYKGFAEGLPLKGPTLTPFI